MLNFERLTVYQKAIDFALLTYSITDRWPKSEIFGLTSQLRHCVTSISLNIAEGSSRTKKEFLHFLDISRGSAYEAIPLLTLALKRKLISENDYQKCYDTVVELTKMISGLRSSLRD